jgi:tRNA threonylcarbamoyladenosine biosynthesis protein TsaE
MSNKWIIDDINDFKKVIDVVLEKAKEISNDNGAVVFALHGNLGAGKTTFTKQLAKYLGINETVTSPTYIIEKKFDIQSETSWFEKMIHIDTYRIDLEDELIKLGWDEHIVDKNNLIVVEWPENIPDILPKNAIHVYFNFIDEVTREVEIK